MIEMLGVLAIIGVLSIGGLYAYRQAIMRYQGNLMIDFVNKVQFVFADLCTDEAVCLFPVSNEANAGAIGRQLICDSLQIKKDCSIRNSSAFEGVPNITWTFYRSSNSQFYNAALYFYNVPPELCQRLTVTNYSKLWRIRVASSSFQKEETTNQNELSEAQKNNLIEECNKSSSSSMIIYWLN